MQPLLLTVMCGLFGPPLTLAEAGGAALAAAVSLGPCMGMCLHSLTLSSS